jgi:hypothetical protein
MPGSSAAGRDSRLAALPPVEHRSAAGRGSRPAALPPVFTGGRLRLPPLRPKTSCAGAPDAGAYPPPRRHSPATRASRACRDGATGRGPRRNAKRSSYRTRRAASRVGCLTPRMGITAFPVAPRWPPCPWILRFSKRNASRSSAGTSAGGCANCDREASAAGECRRGGAGAGIGRASARCLATERGGRSPPRVKTGGRAGGRESRPAAELPGISTRWQIGRASHRRQKCRASPPARRSAEHPTGGRSAAHLHRRQIGRAPHRRGHTPSRRAGRRRRSPGGRRRCPPRGRSPRW